MEWGKAKNILILTFILLNGLLAYQLWTTNMKDSSFVNFAGFYFDNAEVREEMNRLLRNNDIRLEGDIPRETPEMHEIHVTFPPLEQRELTELDMPFHSHLITNKPVPELITSQLPHFHAYEFDQVIPSEDSYSLYQTYESRPLFEVNISLVHRRQQVHSFTQKYVEVLTQEDEEQHSILSAFRAVAYLAEHVLKPGSTIVEVKLGYHGQVFDSDIQVFAPKWRIAIDDGDIYYVHAITGAVEKKGAD